MDVVPPVLVFSAQTLADGKLAPTFSAAAHEAIRTYYPEGTAVEYEVRPRLMHRTERQSRAFHAMVGYWAPKRGVAPDDLKKQLLGEVFGHIDVQRDGEVVRELAEPHTAKLSVEKFVLLIDETLRLAAEDHVLLAAPDEYYTREKETT